MSPTDRRTLRAALAVLKPAADAARAIHPARPGDRWVSIGGSPRQVTVDEARAIAVERLVGVRG